MELLHYYQEKGGSHVLSNSHLLVQEAAVTTCSEISEFMRKERLYSSCERTAGVWILTYRLQWTPLGPAQEVRLYVNIVIKFTAKDRYSCGGHVGLRDWYLVWSKDTQEDYWKNLDAFTSILSDSEFISTLLILIFNISVLILILLSQLFCIYTFF